MRLVCSLTSPYARKIRVILAEKKLDFELVNDVPWNADTHVPDFNPLGKVPALVADDGRIWFDSPVIAEYLDTTYPAPEMIPADRTTALPVRQSEALADGITDAAVLAFLEQKRPAEQQSADTIARQLGKIERGLAALAQRVSDGDGLNHGQLSVADVAAGCTLAYLDFRFGDIDWRGAHAVLADYAAPLLARSSFQGTIPPA
ncbi:MAG: glutathione S-transferase [Rhodocyclaceae bacterium]|nr:glutathione S-transferase [Rhodocyclaceae bacterium]